MTYLCQFYQERALYKVLWCFGQISQSCKVKKLGIQRTCNHTCECTKPFNSWFSLHFFVSLIEKKPLIKFYGAFEHFSRTYEVVMFLIIKLCLDLKDVIHANEHT